MSKIEVNLNKFKSSGRVGKSRIKSGHEDLNTEVYRSLVKVIPTLYRLGILRSSYVNF